MGTVMDLETLTPAPISRLPGNPKAKPPVPILDVLRTASIYAVGEAMEAGEWERAAELAHQAGLEEIAWEIEGGDWVQAQDWYYEELLLQKRRETGFGFFHAIPDRTDFLKYIPHSGHVLVSAYRLAESGKGAPIWRNINQAKEVILDSGQISLLKLAAKQIQGQPEASTGRTTRQLSLLTSSLHQKVVDRMTQQHLLPRVAETLYWAGVKKGYCAMLDHPCEPFLLDKVGLKVQDAVEMTVANAIKWRDVELPPGWTKIYVVQGWELEDYAWCLEMFHHYGILKEIQQGKAWLAVGTTCMRRPNQRNGPGLYDVYEFVRNWGVEGHRHAYGIAKKDWIAHMRALGLIDTADSATGSMQVAFNRGLYSFAKGARRPNYLVGALFAAVMQHLEDELMDAVKAGNYDPQAEATDQELFYSPIEEGDIQKIVG